MPSPSTGPVPPDAAPADPVPPDPALSPAPRRGRSGQPADGDRPSKTRRNGRGFVISLSAITEMRRRRRLLDRVAIGVVAAGVVGIAVAIYLIARPDLGGAASAVVPLAVVSGLRCIDVMLGVFRTAFLVDGRRLPAAAAAATEAAVWISAAGIVLADLSPARIVAFAAGVAGGTLAGMAIIRALRLGMVTLRLFTAADNGALLAEMLRSQGHGATVFTGDGRDGKVAMVLSVMRRRDARAVCATFAHDTSVFSTIDSEPGPGTVISGKPGRTP